LGGVETIMVGSNLTILDQIAKFFLLLSDAPSYWFNLNTSCDHAFHLSKQLDMDDVVIIVAFATAATANPIATVPVTVVMLSLLPPP